MPFAEGLLKENKAVCADLAARLASSGLWHVLMSQRQARGETDEHFQESALTGFSRRFALPALLPLITPDLQLTDTQGSMLTSGYTV